MNGAGEHSEARCSVRGEIEQAAVAAADERAGEHEAPHELKLALRSGSHRVPFGMRRVDRTAMSVPAAHATRVYTMPRRRDVIRGFAIPSTTLFSGGVGRRGCLLDQEGSRIR